MAVLCIICQDPLTDRPQCLSMDEEFITCALLCGHLFHQACIKKWFRGTGGSGLPIGSGTCPSCKRAGPISKALRIFPTNDDGGASNTTAEQTEASHDDDDDDENADDYESLEDQRQQLKERLKAVERKFKDLERQFRTEFSEHYELKLRYAEALSKMDEQEAALKESKEMKEALEDSAKAAVDKAEREKEEALQLLTCLEVSSYNNC